MSRTSTVPPRTGHQSYTTEQYEPELRRINLHASETSNLRSGVFVHRYQGDMFGPYEERTLHTLYTRGYFNPDDEAQLADHGHWVKLSVLWPGYGEDTIPQRSKKPVCDSKAESSNFRVRQPLAYVLTVILAIVSGGALLTWLSTLIN